MQRPQLLDLYFIDARSKLIDIAAFLDRVERAEGEDDFRIRAFREALQGLARDAHPCAAEGAPASTPRRAENVLLAFSDPTDAPVERAGGKGASGAWPGCASSAAS